MRTIEEITAPLTDEQKLLLADVIRHGCWGDCEETFDDGETARCMGFITDDAYQGNHFPRKSIPSRLKSLYKALGLEGSSRRKSSAEMVWIYDWWEDGSGSILLVREPLDDDLDKWATDYLKSLEKPAEKPSEKPSEKPAAETVTIHKVRVFSALPHGISGNRWYLDVPEDTDDYKHEVKETMETELPYGYTVGTDADGKRFILDRFGFVAVLTTDSQERPMLSAGAVSVELTPAKKGGAQ